MDALPGDHPIKSGLFQGIADGTSGLARICCLQPCLQALAGQEDVESAADVIIAAVYKLLEQPSVNQKLAWELYNIDSGGSKGGV